VTVTHPLFPNVRRSPYFAETLAAGASAFMPYNHMYMPISYGRDPRDEYTALTTRVTLWDVGAERQTALTGRDAVRLADHLATRDLSAIEVGQCRFTLICDPEGLIMTEPIVIRPFADTVWISHGDVDLTLWARGLAISGGYDATVHEPDVAPMQLQGPRSVDVINAVTPDVDGLAFYRARETSIAGVPCIVTRTGWSREHGYEIYPLSSGNATRVWTALRDAGEEHDLMVIGPNLSRALEGAITDTHYYVNSGMNPYEAGQGRLVDLDHGPFVGQEALRAIHRDGSARTTVGLLCDPAAEPFPPMAEFWPVTDERGAAIGVVRWAAYSFALERPAAIALLDGVHEPGERMLIHHPGGTAQAEVAGLPFVS
jgi:glycine cleavage system aminomethyltransferase T